MRRFGVFLPILVVACGSGWADLGGAPTEGDGGSSADAEAEAPRAADAGPSDGDAGAGDAGPVNLVAPRPVAPLSTATTTSQRPTFRWSLAAGESGAQIEICRDRACATPVTTFFASGSSGAPPGALARGLYYWRIRAAANGVVGTATSPAWEFFVGARTAAVDTSWGSIVDIDGDGLADFVTIVWSAANTQIPAVFLGTSTGPATTPIPLVAPWAQLRVNWTAASAGDVDGDGYADLIVGNYGLTAELYLGGPGWASRAPIEIASPTGPLPSGFGNIFGSHLAGAGDVNGDGYGDLVIASPVNDGQPPLTYVYFGGKDGPTATPQILTSTANAFADDVAGAGDINGDGYGDVAIASNGAVFSYLGGPTGLVAGATLPTAAGNNNLASGVDVNGDGYSDILTGNPYEALGTLRIFAGSAAGALSTPVIVPAPSGATTLLGSGVASAGDVNGDGYGDVIAASLGNANRGASYAFLGGPAGLSPAPISLVGPGAGVWASDIGGPGDIDGDGLADMLVWGWGGIHVYPGSSPAPSGTSTVTLQ